MPQPMHTFRSELIAEAPSLRALARRLVRDDEADDLAQEAMVTALSTRTRPRSLGPWLRQVVRNEHRARVRSDVRRRDREERSVVPDEPIRPDHEVARRELLDALREVVAELDEPYRAALIARFVEERSAAEIARSEDCPHATVRWRVQEALRRTRRKMDERFDGRQHWLGSMAAFAGVPIDPASTALTTGATTMNKIAILKALTVTAVAAGAATLIVSSVTEVTAADGSQTTDAAADVSSSNGDKPAIEPASVDPAFAVGPDGNAVLQALQPGDDAGPRDGLECEGPDGECGGSPLPSAVMADCLDSFPLAPGQAVNMTVHLGPSNDEGRLIERIEVVSSKDEEVAELAKCLTDKLAGSTLIMPGLDADTQAVQMSLREDGEDGDPALGSPQWATDADTIDPMQAPDKLKLPRHGAEDAKVSIVECAEFDCPFCEKARHTIDQIRADYGDEVAIHWMHNPLPFHQTASVAARAAWAAQQQGKFWEMHDLLFDEPQARTPEAIVELANQIGLDVGRFEADMESDAAKEALAAQKATCEGNGARGTPSFFIAGDLLVGAQPYEAFKKILDDELTD